MLENWSPLEVSEFCFFKMCINWVYWRNAEFLIFKKKIYDQFYGVNSNMKLKKVIINLHGMLWKMNCEFKSDNSSYTQRRFYQRVLSLSSQIVIVFSCQENFSIVKCWCYDRMKREFCCSRIPKSHKLEIWGQKM